MKTRVFILSLAAAACFLALPVQAKTPRIQPGKHRVELIVCMSQAGRVGEEELAVARSTVRLLFAQIGVAVRFTNEAPQADTRAIALRLWESAPSGLSRSVMGSASLGGRRARQANVFYDRVIGYSQRSGPHEIGLLLGYAMAHELGHVLRGDTEHSPLGVMKASWGRLDATAMLQGLVHFSSADADRIREVLAEQELVLDGAR